MEEEEDIDLEDSGASYGRRTAVIWRLGQVV